MSTLTKNQHYVWRYYLKDWENDGGNLFCLIQDQRRVISTRTYSIAVERYFYKTEELNELELKWIHSIIDRASQPELRDFHRKTVEIFQAIYLLRSRLGGLDDISPELRSAAEQEIDALQKTLGERWHTGIETASQHILESLKQADSGFYTNELDRNTFIHFIAQQFCRTPKIRKLHIRQNNPFFEKGLDLDRTWFIESQIYAMNIGTSIVSEHAQYKFKFLSNDAPVSFITGDQPVISLGPDVAGVRLFYPLGPKLALLFEKDALGPLRTERRASTLEVEFYNSKMHQQSYNQLYGNDREYLETIIAMPKNLLPK